MSETIKSLASCDYCRCGAPNGLKVQCNASEEPTACLVCNRVVALGRLRLGDDARTRLDAWRRVADAVYALWLSDGPYSEYAESQMCDWSSHLNITGADITRLMQEQTSLRCVLSIVACGHIGAEVRRTGACFKCLGGLADLSNEFAVQFVCDRCGLVWIVE